MAGREANAPGELACCNGTYRRGCDGRWRYPWGELVRGATDLTFGDVLALQGPERCPEDVAMRPLTDAERAWIRGEPADPTQVFVRQPPPGGRPDLGDLVLGMLAPELHVDAMLTVADIGELAGVSKATVDSYRYRGSLPAPQATRGRTPLWARPIVHRWLHTRPGPGWRRDLYGELAPSVATLAVTGPLGPEPAVLETG